MKQVYLLLALVGSSYAINLHSKTTDEVDDLLTKQDQKDENDVMQKEFNDANSKMNQIGQHSRDHQAAEDEDYMKSVFDAYSQQGKDKKGNLTGDDLLMKDKAYEASRDIIMKWNDLPEQNTKKYLDGKFDAIWNKLDVNNAGYIDVTEAF